MKQSMKFMTSCMITAFLIGSVISVNGRTEFFAKAEAISQGFLKDDFERQKVKEDVPSIKKVLEQYQENFAGIYYNSVDGTLIVKTVNPQGTLEKSVLDQSSYPQNIVFEMAQFSEKELEEASEHVIKNAPLNLIRAIFTDIIRAQNRNQCLKK